MKPSQKKLKAAQYLTKIEDDIIEIMNEKEQQSKDTAPSRGTTRQSENTKSEMTKSIKKERKDATRNVKKMVKKQETVKKAKKSVKNFLDDEAGEGFESEEEKEQQKRGSKNGEFYFNMFILSILHFQKLKGTPMNSSEPKRRDSITLWWMI